MPHCAGHRDTVRDCFVSEDGDGVFTVARDGGVFVWAWRRDLAP
ncbi:unnamed protein product, partial [Discosporangium mesarthrocarpum]